MPNPHKVPETIRQAGMNAEFKARDRREACERGDPGACFDYDPFEYRDRALLEHEPGMLMGGSTFSRDTTFTRGRPDPDISETAQATPSHKE